MKTDFMKPLELELLHLFLLSNNSNMKIPFIKFLSKKTRELVLLLNVL